MHLPKSFPKLKKAVGLARHKDEKKLLVRFSYRYRLASSFQYTHAPAVGRTLHGYDAILKLFLAYTAYEQVLKPAVRLNVFGILSVDRNEITDITIAQQLRANVKLMNFLINYSTDAKLAKRIRDFLDNKSDDVTRVAYAIRNVYAHGDLTPSAIGLSTHAQQDVLWDLAKFLLVYSDNVFDKCVDKMR